ncbi:MAG: ammonium transporter [Acidobacteria bacterium]|nr:ammonium transporter [Acidobacteriota bacterium]MDP7337725.1 ammonium transporter [Vicinamibacterales bacterium]HJN45017.1 ammonium transporter [Vicinamibacterales bacterium]
MTNRLPRLVGRYTTLLLLGLVLLPSVAYAQDEVSQEMFTVNNTWMLVATFLVFIMHLGFATLESGLTQAKNTVNILFKNTGIVAIGLLTYAIVGFNLMYPGDFSIGQFFGFAGFGLDPGAEGNTIAYASGAYTYWTDFIFQAMFAATAATIVSGAVAERVKLGPFLIFTTIYVAFIYPIAGSWKWGAGWLDQMGFYDFAGSTLVHSVGGWAALAGIIVLGPRLGKYVDGKIRPVAGHSMPLATIGVFLLWLGWYGFNGGSVLSADPALVSLVFVTTSLASAAGVLGAMAASWTLQHKPDLSMVLNGSLAGLVGITAGADTVSVNSAMIIGLVAGVIVVASVLLLDRARIDDPVGAVSVHLVCGVWGTLAVGIFSTNAEHSFMTQLIGVGSYALFCFSAALIIFFALKATVGLRVSPEEERTGLDVSEHGMEAYGGFQIAHR